MKCKTKAAKHHQDIVYYKHHNHLSHHIPTFQEDAEPIAHSLLSHSIQY